MMHTLWLANAWNDTPCKQAELTNTLEDLSSGQEGLRRGDTELVGACLDRSGTSSLESSRQEFDVGLLVAGNLSEALSDPSRAEVVNMISFDHTSSADKKIKNLLLGVAESTSIVHLQTGLVEGSLEVL